MRDWGFIGPTYVGQSRLIDGERCVNYYPELAESGHGKSRWVLCKRPGKQLFATLPDTPVRGLWAGDYRLFAVGGSTLYEVSPEGVPTGLGDVGGSYLDPVTMFSNGNQLFIVSAGQGYLADGVTVRPVVKAVTGAYLDGYFIAQQPDSRQFNISALYDGSTWDPLDYGLKEGSPDHIVAIAADHKELWLFGSLSAEVWYNAGSADFPFQPIGGGFIEHGCWAGWSIVKLDNSLYWLGGDSRGAGVVWRARQFAPERVSNYALETAMQGYKTMNDARGYGIQEHGHSFYILHFPTADKAWALDVGNGMWHERTWLDPVRGEEHADRARCHAFAFKKHLVGDYRSGKIWEQSIRFADDAGDPIRRLRRAPHLSDEMRWMRYHAMHLDMQVGVSPSTGQGADPQVMLQFSDDGGFTWSNEMWASAGKIGEYRARVKWRRLGRSRDRVFQTVITDPINEVLIDAYLEASAGTGR